MKSNIQPNFEAADDTLRHFHKFPDLPAEIQLQIWQHAVPDLDTIRCKIELILNFDLGCPRAILPSAASFKEAFATASGGRYSQALEGTENGYWQMGDNTMAESQRPILSLMHTCHTSRLATMKTYRLDIGSRIEEENKPWWIPEEDMVILPQREDMEQYFTTVLWLSACREDALPALESLQHLALVVNGHVIEKFSLSNGDDPDDNPWLFNFPNLRSLTFLVDPGNIFAARQGNVLLYESNDVPIQFAGGLRPSAIVRQVTRLFLEAFEEALEDDEEVPLIELFVVGRRKMKHSRILN